MIKKPKNIDPELYFSPFPLIAKGNDLINGIYNSMSNYKYEENKCPK